MNALSNIIDPEAKESGIFPPPPPQQHPKGPRSQHRPDARAASSAPYPPGGEKLAATNERPRRRLTPASRRAALPGDPGGSAFSPLPRCALPRRRAAPGLYIGRALAALGVPPVRELPSARAGGGPGRRAALSLLLCPPTPLRGLLPPRPPPRPRKQTFRLSPPLSRPLFVSVRAGPRRTEGSSHPTRLQFRPLQDPEKMSTTLLSAFYDIDFLCKVSRTVGKDGGLPGTLRVLRLGCRARLERKNPSKLTFRVEGSPGVSSPVCLRLWAWRAGRVRVAAGAAALLPSRLRPRSRDFPDSVCAAHPVATGPGSHGQTRRGQGGRPPLSPACFMRV